MPNGAIPFDVVSYPNLAKIWRSIGHLQLRSSGIFYGMTVCEALTGFDDALRTDCEIFLTVQIKEYEGYNPFVIKEGMYRIANKLILVDKATLPPPRERSNAFSEHRRDPIPTPIEAPPVPLSSPPPSPSPSTPLVQSAPPSPEPSTPPVQSAPPSPEPPTLPTPRPIVRERNTKSESDGAPRTVDEFGYEILRDQFHSAPEREAAYEKYLEKQNSGYVPMQPADLVRPQSIHEEEKEEPHYDCPRLRKDDVIESMTPNTAMRLNTLRFRARVRADHERYASQGKLPPPPPLEDF